MFGPESDQKDVYTKVSMPLVENLLKGRNGLLFTYGVTGSGKTFTMTGTPQDSGILPRSLDVIFNSISGYQVFNLLLTCAWNNIIITNMFPNNQARKHTFKPDRMNGFDVQSGVDAARDRQHELISNIEAPNRTRMDYPKTPRKYDHKNYQETNYFFFFNFQATCSVGKWYSSDRKCKDFNRQ